MFGYKRFLLFSSLLLLILGVFALPSAWAQAEEKEKPGFIYKKYWELDVRSHGRQVADEVAESGNRVSKDDAPASGQSGENEIQRRGGNVQVNDPNLDNIQTFAGTRPFVKFTQSETSVASHGKNIVATYNSSANQPIVQIGTGLFFVHRFLSAFSTSNDGGKTWTSGFMPPVPGSIFTFGDPSVDVDRRGNFFFAGLGTDASFNGTVQVNKSTDGGRTWSDAVIVQVDNGSDKEWLAVGPDPRRDEQQGEGQNQEQREGRDNVYVTWTSFQPTGSQLRFGRSIDGGATWTTKTIFAPPSDPNPAHPQNFIQFSVPTVDPENGRLYIPFLHFSNSDQDFIRILVSDDAGETFRFLRFNISGAPDPTLLPIVTAGELIDCGGGGFRNVIRSGAPLSPGRFGLRRFRFASRLVTQPAFAAREGKLFLAWSNSTSPFFGDPNGQSNIKFIRSANGGATWTTPIDITRVGPDIQHVLPSLAADDDGEKVHITFYTQHSDGTVGLDMADSRNGGISFPASATVQVSSVSSPLAPTNNPIPTPTSPFATTNYDRTIQPCYCLGEYQSVKSGDGKVHVLWGDTRNTVTEPPNTFVPFLSGLKHSQEDVFFQKFETED